MSAMKQKCKHSRELVLHDQLNLIVLPVLTVMATAGLLGWLDTYKVTVTFMAYIAFDFCWLYLYPTSVPSLANVVLGHHVVTFVLLTFPFRHPDFGNFTCWDGLTELNTWFLILRRQCSYPKGLLNSCFWVTYIPMRLFMYPGLLVQFWQVLEGFPTSERLLVCTCQFLLCCFNFSMFYMSIARRLGRSSAKRLTPLRSVEQEHRVQQPSKLKPTRPNNVMITARGGAF